MREQFRGFYGLTPDELSDLWRDGAIVLDTSVLLNLYRYSLATREDLLGILDQLRERIWIPHQVGLEFHRNRIAVMAEQRDVYAKLRGVIDTARQAILKATQPLARHPVIDAQKFEAEVSSHFGELVTYVAEREREHPDLPENAAPGSVDSTRDRLAEILAGRVGEPFTPEELAESYSLGEKRYQDDIPPGFADGGKEIPDRYGDFLIWLQLLKHARSEPRSVMFVTDDRKEDWWQIHRGQAVGPRPELIEEFYCEVGRSFHMYRADQFLRWAHDYLASEVSTDAVDEVRAVAEEQSSATVALANLYHRREAQLEAALIRRSRLIERLPDEESIRAEEHARSLRQLHMVSIRRQHECDSRLSELASLLTDHQLTDNERVMLEDRISAIENERTSALAIGDSAKAEFDKLTASERSGEHRRPTGSAAGIKRQLDEVDSRIGTIEAELEELRRLGFDSRDSDPPALWST